METKHINDPHDPTAIEVKELSAQQDREDEAVDKAGPDMVFRDLTTKEPAARSEHRVHRMAGRIVHKHRGRR